jgi:hypothetical protein
MSWEDVNNGALVFEVRLTRCHCAWCPNAVDELTGMQWVIPVQSAVGSQVLCGSCQIIITDTEVAPDDTVMQAYLEPVE